MEILAGASSLRGAHSDEAIQRPRQPRWSLTRGWGALYHDSRDVERRIERVSIGTPLPAAAALLLRLEAAMAIERKRPLDLVERVARRRALRTNQEPQAHPWRREVFCLPRLEARQKAREWFERYPKAAYMTEIEFWRVLEDDQIEFVMRRLPTAD
jgi:hypothetical protein